MVGAIVGVTVVALMLLAHWVGENTLVLAVVCAMPPRILIAGVFVAGASVVALWPRRRLTASIGVVLLALAVVAVRPSPPPTAAAARLRVAAWNIAKGAGGLEAIARGLAAIGADVICLSEAGSYRWLRDEDSARLPELLGEPWQLVGDGEVRALSRLPVVSVSALPLAPGPAARPLLVVGVVQDTTVVSIACLHLMPKLFAVADSVDRGEAHDGTASEIVTAIREQGRGLAEHLRSLPRPLIVGGDWNASAWGRIVGDVLDDGFVDALAGSGIFARTVGSGLTGRRIDHLLVSDDLRVARAEILEVSGSDHLPIVVDVTW